MAAPRDTRIVLALGGNAIAGERGAAPDDQQAAVEGAMEQVAGIVAHGHEVVLTHGNGPQVGNILLKNDLTRHIVPSIPLDWCVAQTQATLGFLMVSALEEFLARRGIDRLVTVVVTRVRVDPDDPGFARPSKPIGRYLPESEARARVADGEAWEDRGAKGWRRVVASPDPLEIVDARAVIRAVEEGAIVVAAGGGGIPVVRDDGHLRGVEAVLDKDLSGALLARTVGADTLVIATDVEAAAIGFGTPAAERIGRIRPEELRELVAQGHFESGSMGPKVEAVLRFVEGGGRRAVITSLEHLEDALEGGVGTQVEGGRG